MSEHYHIKCAILHPDRNCEYAWMPGTFTVAADAYTEAHGYQHAAASVQRVVHADVHSCTHEECAEEVAEMTSTDMNSAILDSDNWDLLNEALIAADEHIHRIRQNGGERAVEKFKATALFAWYVEQNRRLDAHDEALGF